ncbi:MAG: hypothetical protein BMS9Abin07_1551 [Acidimicrobiia bacterium]|nr:MAG: hypothetical protein BMS9Abin07_1551 [Acidimicrobiia bacterium]
MLELAETIWNKMRPGESFRFESDPPFEYDVQRRIPSTHKAEELLGFEAATSLDEMLEEVMPWVL